MLCSFLCFCVVFCGFVCICTVFVYILQILYSHPTFVAIVCVFRSFCVYCVHCVPFWRVCTVCIVCVVYTVSRFGLFVQCVLWPMCTNPVFHCLQCVPNELFIKVPRLGFPVIAHCTHSRFVVFVHILVFLCILCGFVCILFVFCLFCSFVCILVFCFIF